uniref:Splicing factor U2af large subunit n=2 Tax=Brassica oleracea var. oleracea TaxID=109376 RepID=A0A0D3E564_BRAOL
MRHDEANGDENNKNENYLALGLESSPFKSLGGEDSKSRVRVMKVQDWVGIQSRMLKRNLQEAEARTVRVRGAGREIGSETAIVREMMMITEFEGGGLAIVRERRDTGDVHALDREVARVGLSIDHVPGQDHRPRGTLASLKRVSGFDMPPPSSAMLAPTAVAAAGQVPSVPATPNIPGMFPNVLAMVPNQQLGALSLLPVQAMTQQATRHARRVYVGGLPPTANEQSVATFFSQVMSAVGGNTAGPGDAVVNVYINHEKKFAFVEMRSVEEASNAMALDGIILEGVPVKVKRPTDYNPSLAAALGPSQPNPNLNLAAVGFSSGSTGGLEGPDRLFVGGIPYYLTEDQIRELLESFGPLRGFNLVKDRESGNSMGYAFCVFQDPSVTDMACAALNGIKMGNKTLTVRRAVQGAIQPKPEQEDILLHAQQQIALQRLMLQPGGTPTKIVCLTQVVTANVLGDDKEYEDITEDMRQEGGKFGNLVNVVIPRPNPEHDPTPGVGKVFLEYADLDSAAKARSGMNGRKFDGNQVVAVYYPENKYAQGDYEAC